MGGRLGRQAVIVGFVVECLEGCGAPEALAYSQHRCGKADDVLRLGSKVFCTASSQPR